MGEAVSVAPWIVAAVVIAALLIVRVACPSVFARKPRPPAPVPRYCTKHVLRQSMIPGGPERLVWQYGVHRTRGNACDGREHQRVSGWW